MTDTPTFQELLTSQEARDRATTFKPADGNGSHWMTVYGHICNTNQYPFTDQMAIWQGWLTDCAPPPEPRVFKRVEYRPVLKVEGVYRHGFETKDEAQQCGKVLGGMVACVRVEITATEGVFDD